MSTGFPFVEIPKNLLPAIGEPDPGTHIYRKSGPDEDMSKWFAHLSSLIGPTLSPGGVCMYCPVSRAAVHKRAKEGKLSMFLYHPDYSKQSLFGKEKKIRKRPYGYIPLSEIQAWRREIEERVAKQGKYTQEELEGKKPDHDGDFLEWPVKSERQGMLDVLREMGVASPIELVSQAINSWRNQGKGTKVTIPVSKNPEGIPEREHKRREEAGIESIKRKARRRKGTK